MKIFCIGLNKSGTSSIHRALEMLEFRSLHLGGPEVPREIKRALEEGRGLVDTLGDYDAFSDIWRLSERFDLLDRQYPGSKFILTIRELDDWLDSRRRHVERNVRNMALGRYQGALLTVDIEAWTREYHEHHARVLEHFAERPNDLLVMNIAREPDRSMGDRWYRPVHIPAGFSHYPAFVSRLRHRSASWNIAVAPLRDTPFNRSKGDLKFLEYSALGLPGVFSDIIPYSRSVKDGATGLLVPNEDDAWYEAIVQPARNGDLRTRLAHSVTAMVVGERCLKYKHRTMSHFFEGSDRT